MKIHLRLSVRGALKNPQHLKGCITTDEGKTLTSIKEIKEFLRYQLAMGREYLPIGECDNFDYHKGCLGHEE